MQRKYKIASTILVLLFLGGVVYWIEKPGLRLEVEGLYLDHNFRDVGQSLNACFEEKGNVDFHFQPGKLMRSNRWFSGWNCEQVGNPEVIVTLNYRLEKDHTFYCRNRRDRGAKVIGFSTRSPVELVDVEFLSTWDNPVMLDTICQSLEVILESVAEGQRTLFHCDAGRDRTGAFSALLAGLTFESHGGMLTDPAFLAALECDYQKSPSLVQEKYGRISAFMQAIEKDAGGVRSLLQQRCDFEPSLLSSFAEAMAP